jgi:hypothetical protein
MLDWCVLPPRKNAINATEPGKKREGEGERERGKERERERERERTGFFAHFLGAKAKAKEEGVRLGLLAKHCLRWCFLNPPTEKHPEIQAKAHIDECAAFMLWPVRLACALRLGLAAPLRLAPGWTDVYRRIALRLWIMEHQWKSDPEFTGSRWLRRKLI